MTTEDTTKNDYTIDTDGIIEMLNQNQEAYNTLKNQFTRDTYQTVLSYIDTKRDPIVKQMLVDGIEPDRNVLAKLEAYNEIYQFIGKKLHPESYEL